MNSLTKVYCLMLIVFMIYLNTVHVECALKFNPSTYKNIYTTYDIGVGIGACSLPKGNYAVRYPIGLGNIPALGGIKFDADLCGHVFTINCGKGDVDVIVTNSYAGGGLNLPKSTWNKATNSKQGGITRCSITHSNKNPLNSSKPTCYFATGEVSNQYYRNVGILNTNGRIVVSAKLKGKSGNHHGQNPYYVFHGQSSVNDKVTFYFNDITSYSVKIGDCINGANKQIWG